MNNLKMNVWNVMLLLLITLLGACGQQGGDNTTEDAASASDAPGVAVLHVSAPGMHCDGCTATVEETLAKMQGVDSVHADLESKEVTVYCDTTQTARSALVGMIDRLGFAEAAAE